MERQEFHDFDAFANSINGIDSKMLLRDPERRSWTIDRLELPGIELQLGRLGSGNVACGQTHADRCILYLPLTSGIEYRGNGSIINRDSFFVLYPDAEFCITTREPHEWCGAFIPTEQLTGKGTESILQPCCVGPRDPASANRFRDISLNALAAAATCPGFEESEAAKRAASELLNLLRPIPFHRSRTARQTHGRPKLTRDEIIHRSFAIVEENRHEYPSVAELAGTCGVSERTLRTVFHEYFGLGPSRFLQLRQLHDVRRALLSADPDGVTVAQIMAGHGVWAFGRFAKRYFDLFGELPSATLRLASGL